MRLPLALMLLLSAPVFAQDELPAPTAGEEPKLQQQVGYCLGLDLGKRLREDQVQIDLASIVAGLRDGLSGADPMLNEEEITAVMGQFRQLMQQKAEKKMAQIADENLARGEAFLKENGVKEGVQTTESGLQYRVVEEGDGASPGPTDTVRCHYEGKLINGEVFDSSIQRGQPAEFPVNRVIAGWTEALQMMKVGGKWEVFLPAKIAYGLRGAPGAIGPNETLIFQIELIDIVN